MNGAKHRDGPKGAQRKKRMIDNQPPSQPESAQLKPRRWWRSRRILLALVCSSLISVLLGLGLFYYAHSKTGSPPGTPRRAPPPCLSPDCLKAAERLSAAADPFAQPCDYFLASCRAEGPAAATRGRQRGKELAQGKAGLEERAPGNERQGGVVNLGKVTDGQPNTDTLSDRLADKQTALLQVLRDILESPDRPSSVNSAEQKVRRFYRSCMDTGTIEKAGPQPVLKLIEKLGGWAVSGKWNRTDFNVILSLLMKEYATFPFFSVYVGKNPNDSDSSGHRKYIQIDQPDFHIPVEWDSKKQKSTVNVTTVLQLLSFHLQLLALLGVPSSSTNLHTGKFLQLVSELTLAASPLTHRLQQQLLYQRMTLKELQAAAPAIDWLGCLRETFHPIPVNQSDVVLLHNLPYIIHMSKTISKWQSDPEMTGSGPLHTFMILSLLHKVIPALNSEFAEIQRNLSVGLGDRLDVIPHWKKCILETEKGFDTVLIALLKERVGEKEAEEFIENIYSSLKSSLSMLKWRDEELHSSILNRVGSLTPRLSINKEILSQEKIDQQYSEVAVSEDDYFSNYLQTLSLQQKRRTKLFSQTTALDILSLTPSFSSEEINVPLGMFVPPAFHPSYPRAVNYGILGTLMAKEILYLLLPDIQSQSEAPKKVSDCVWAHYLHLTKSVRRTDPPPLTPAQQQAIWVQHTALIVALQAYEQSLLKYRGDTSLSSLSYTHLFLASFAQNNCNSDPVKERLPFEPFFLVGKTFELLNCDQHKSMIIKNGRDPGSIRPDITHQCLLMLLDSPLNRAGLLQVYVHTEKNALIEINPQTRIPRTFARFCGLMVQLLHKLSVRAADGPQRLLRLIKNPVSDHLPPGCPRIATSFSAGEAVCPRTVVPEEGPATVVIGAFAHGAVNVDYTEKTVSISNYPLSAALTCAKMCSAFEEVWGVL